MPSKRSAALGFIFITVLVDVIGLGIIIPVIPTLVVELTGDTLSGASRTGGWLMFCYAVMQFVFAPVLGSLSDRYGRRPVLLISLLGLGIDYLLHAWAPTLAWLVAGRLLAGMAGASFTTANAYIADISTPEKKAQNFGLVGAAFGLGFIIGPVLGGVFSQWGVRVPFLVAAGLSFINVLYGMLILPESLPVAKHRAFDWRKANPMGALSHLRRYPVVSGLIIAIFLGHLAAHSLQSTWTFYTMYKFQWDEKMVGYSLGLVGILVVAVQAGLIRITMPLLGAKRSVFYGMLLWALGQFLFAIASEGWMLMLFLVPYALGGIASPSIQGIISNQVPDTEQGELQGAITSVISLTSILGPLLMTNLFAHFSGQESRLLLPGAPYLMGSFLVLLALFFAMPSMRRLTSGA